MRMKCFFILFWDSIFNLLLMRQKFRLEYISTKLLSFKQQSIANETETVKGSMEWNVLVSGKPAEGVGHTGYE